MNPLEIYFVAGLCAGGAAGFMYGYGFALEGSMPRGNRTVHVRDADDRMRTALQLIASLQFSAEDKRLALAVNTAKAALSEDDGDPMCEVLR